MHYVVVIVVISLFLHCIFKTYSSIRLSSCKCLINSVFSVHLRVTNIWLSKPQYIQYWKVRKNLILNS